MQRRWQVLKQEDDRVMHGRGAHEVVVVKDQDTGGGQGSQVVDQAGDQNEKGRVASSASQANQAGESTASSASSPAAVPWSCPSATEGICVIPCPVPIRRLTYPTYPTTR